MPLGTSTLGGKRGWDIKESRVWSVYQNVEDVVCFIFRFKFDLFRGVISEVVNLTETAEEGLEAAAAKAAAATPDFGSSGCSFRFLLAEGSRLQLGVETNAGSC